MKDEKLNIEKFKALSKNAIIEELLQGTIKGGCCRHETPSDGGGTWDVDDPPEDSDHQK